MYNKLCVSLRNEQRKKKKGGTDERKQKLASLKINKRNESLGNKRSRKSPL